MHSFLACQDSCQVHSTSPHRDAPASAVCAAGSPSDPHLADGFGAGLFCRLGQRALVEAGVGRPVPELELLREVQHPRQLVLRVLGNCSVWDVTSAGLSATPCNIKQRLG